eukprot:TRINITY_DN105888_c0_g1_i1.p1 TRINITY_DN105888_c0_g1~~TRINITY_DN105888_c0_g1_i1.p1  ORF type:complete len:164 (-),score=33.32 TRINITY_DN105888_c0_g1_i1:142-633(-)
MNPWSVDIESDNLEIRNRAIDQRNIAVARTRSHAEAAALVGPSDPQYDFMRFMADCEEEEERRRRRRRRQRKRHRYAGYDCESDETSDQDEEQSNDSFEESGSDDDDSSPHGDMLSRKSPRSKQRGKANATAIKRPASAALKKRPATKSSAKMVLKRPASRRK